MANRFINIAPAVIALLGFILWILIERFYSLQRQEDGQVRERATYQIISIFWYGAIFISLADAWQLRWTIYDVPGLNWLGVVLVITGLILRVRARIDLGRQYSPQVETSAAHQLVTHGIYHHLRHPAYAALLCLLTGIPLSSSSLAGLVLALGGGLPAVVQRIKIEEEMLQERFGESYHRYQQDTRRMIPYIW